MDVTGLGQNFLIYQPRSLDAGEPTQLTQGVWNQQMQKLSRVLESAPTPVKAGGVGPVEGRDGKVLGPENIIKEDQFPTLHLESLQPRQPRIEGAPNYRELGEGIHGTAQPTIDGMRGVLAQAGSGPGGSKKSVWFNLREEPVVYINGKPLNVRHFKAPFNNQAAPGRSSGEVDQLERDLKQDVLAEAKRNGGFITVVEEVKGANGKPVLQEKKVPVESVQTVSEVYDQLKQEGFNVEYKRLPVTDMKKPEDRDIDELVSELKKTSPDDQLIFNCHAGQGRTTTAMVLASITRRAQRGESGESITRDEAVRADIKEQGKHNPRNYRSILQAIKDTVKLMGSRSEADEVIARYGEVHDLKKTVGEARESASHKTDPEARRSADARVDDYLERYHTIISFDRYVKEQGPDFQVPYSQWKAERPEMDETLRRAQLARAGQRSESGTAMA